jgi:precorrin-6A synthase
MRQIFIIGIGAGHPDHVTVQAINALNQVDVVFVMDKGQEKDDLVRLRKEICERYIKDRSYRIVETADPRRDPAAPYETAVQVWHEQRAEIYERLIVEELGEDECGAFLVWGDPSLYDSTLRIIDQLIERGNVAFIHEVIPGITAVQALAAGHKIALNRIGKSIHITTGRKLSQGLPDGIDDVVVMLDGDCAFKTIDAAGIDIYWGAYVGTSDEILIAGDLHEVADEIERVRTEAKARKGWVMDTYLLRKRDA